MNDARMSFLGGQKCYTTACSGCNVQHPLECGGIEGLNRLSKYQNCMQFGRRITHLITLDKPFNGCSLKDPVTVQDDVYFTRVEMLTERGLLAGIQSGLPALLGVFW
jgi:hypothetical protein